MGVTALLFISTALLWGGGALATAFQAGPVPAVVSVGWRMVAAGLLMMGWAHIRGVRLRLTAADWASFERQLPDMEVDHGTDPWHRPL